MLLLLPNLSMGGSGTASSGVIRRHHVPAYRSSHRRRAKARRRRRNAPFVNPLTPTSPQNVPAGEATEI